MRNTELLIKNTEFSDIETLVIAKQSPEAKLFLDMVRAYDIGMHNLMRYGYITNNATLDLALGLVDKNRSHPVFSEAILPE
jgi:hypothetical protein